MRLPYLAEVDAQARAALWTKHLVLALCVEAVVGAALPVAGVPGHVGRGRVHEQVAKARAGRAVAVEDLVAVAGSGIAGLLGGQWWRERHAEFDVAAVAAALVCLARLAIS